MDHDFTMSVRSSVPKFTFDEDDSVTHTDADYLPVPVIMGGNYSKPSPSTALRPPPPLLFLNAASGPSLLLAQCENSDGKETGNPRPPRHSLLAVHMSTTLSKSPSRTRGATVAQQSRFTSILRMASTQHVRPAASKRLLQRWACVMAFCCRGGRSSPRFVFALFPLIATRPLQF